MVVVVVFKAETFWNLDRRDKTNAKVVFCICISFAYNLLWGIIKKSRERERGPFILSEKYVCFVWTIMGRREETRREF